MYGVDAYGTVPFGASSSEPFDAAAVLDASREDLVYTVEIAVWEIGGSAEEVLRIASAEWATEPGDVPASTPFDGRLLSYSFSRSINTGDRFGGLAAGTGEIVFANTDGAYDAFIDGYAVDGREVVVRLGRKTDPLHNHFVVFRGVAVDWRADQDAVTLEIKDKADRLDVPAQPNVYPGVGGSGGVGLGSELVTNGTFNSNISGWGGNTGSFDWQAGGGNGWARCFSVGGAPGLEQSITTVAGKSYRIFVRGRHSGSPPSGTVTVKWGGTTLGSFGATSSGTYDVVASGASTTLRVEIDSASSAMGFDDASVKLILEGPGGGPDVEGKRKPLTFGQVAGVPPVLVDPALLIYQVHDHDDADGFVAETVAVYDRGVALTMLATVDEYTDLEGASISSGQAMSSRDGYFRIGGALAGVVFATVQSYLSGAAPATVDVVEAILSRHGILAEDEIDRASFDALEADPEPSFIGVHVSAEDSSTVADFITSIMSGIGGWAAFTRQGQFTLGVLSAPSGTPVARLARDEGDIIDMTRETMPDGIWPPPWRWRVAYRHNYTVFTDFAGSVPSAERLFYAEPYRLVEASNSVILDTHPSGKDTPPVEAFYDDLGRAQSEADRLLDLYTSGYRLHRATIGRRGLGLKLGEEITITFPRYGFDAGRDVVIVTIEDKVDLRDGGEVDQVEVTVFG
ncbi:MAG: hypothetical protein KF723_22205 [Rhizobiaceae bacterium]|nr:hypothetical protein [Rhizobiaceae bacterium]